jgi:Papain fold toxin 1, glutamine deamidase
MSAQPIFLNYGEDAHLSHVNPDFHIRDDNNSLGKQYKINCVSCAIATDSNLAGIKVRASPLENRQDVEDIQNIYGREFRCILEPGDIHREEHNRKIEILSAKMDWIKNFLINAGEKSRVIICVYRRFPNQPTIGHVFNAWNRGEGVIEFLDGQNNKIVTGFYSEIAIVLLLQTGFVNQQQ